jgi:hypothetical protein
MKKTAIFTVLPVVIGAFFLSGCSGYVHKSLLPGDIKSIKVPVFGNNTTEHDMELTITKAVTNELASATDLRITDTNPDSILKGTLVDTVYGSLIEGDFGTVTSGEVSLEVALVWMDARTNNEIPLRSKTVSASATYNILRGESRALAVQKAADLLAKRIVEAMQEEW